MKTYEQGGTETNQEKLERLVRVLLGEPRTTTTCDPVAELEHVITAIDIERAEAAVAAAK